MSDLSALAPRRIAPRMIEKGLSSEWEHRVRSTGDARTRVVSCAPPVRPSDLVNPGKLRWASGSMNTNVRRREREQWGSSTPPS